MGTLAWLGSRTSSHHGLRQGGGRPAQTDFRIRVPSAQGSSDPHLLSLSLPKVPCVDRKHPTHCEQTGCLVPTKQTSLGLDLIYKMGRTLLLVASR